MEEDKIVTPVGVQKVLQFMTAEQELLNAKRTELIKQLRYNFYVSYQWTKYIEKDVFNQAM